MDNYQHNYQLGGIQDVEIVGMGVVRPRILLSILSCHVWGLILNSRRYLRMGWRRIPYLGCKVKGGYKGRRALKEYSTGLGPGW